MEVNYHSQDIIITDAMRERVASKFSKLDRYFQGNASAEVFFKGKSFGRCAVETTLTFRGLLLRAEAGGKESVFKYIDMVADRLDGQIRKYRTKLSRRYRDSLAPDPLAAADAAEDDQRAVRHKTYSRRPMSEEDAIMQMDLVDHPFYVYIDAHTGETHVVYKRSDGSVGLIVPE